MIVNMNSTPPFNDFVKKLEADQQCAAILFKFKQTYAININLLLFLLWFSASQHGRISKKEIGTLSLTVGHWHERVSLALRRVELKLASNKQLPSIREWIHNELEYANELEQKFLAEALNLKLRPRSVQQQLGDACYNLSLYCKHLKLHLNVKYKECSIYLLQFIFPSIDRATIVKNCNNALQSLANTSELGAQLLFDEL